MTEEDAFRIVQSAVVEVVQADIKVDSSTNLVKEGVVDSLDFVRLIHEIERESQRRMPINDFEDITQANVGDLVTALQRAA